MVNTLMLSENMASAARSQMERMTGIEPALSAWELACYGSSDKNLQVRGILGVSASVR